MSLCIKQITITQACASLNLLRAYDQFLACLKKALSSCYIHRTRKLCHGLPVNNPFAVVALAYIDFEECLYPTRNTPRWYCTLLYRVIGVKETTRQHFLCLSALLPVEVLYLILERYIALL